MTSIIIKNECKAEMDSSCEELLMATVVSQWEDDSKPPGKSIGDKSGLSWFGAKYKLAELMEI